MLEYAIMMKVTEAFHKKLPQGIDIMVEYQTAGNRRADLVIVNGFEILACIEIKSNISDEKLLLEAQAQVELIQKDTHSYYAVITDGDRYYVKSLSNERFEEKRDAEAVIKVILGVDKEKERDNDFDIESLRNYFSKICMKYDMISNINKIKKVLEGVSSANCEVTATRFKFKRSFENAFFQSLLGTYTDKEIVRYIPFSSVFRTLNEQTIGMVSLVGMNDVSECYYADQFCAKINNKEWTKGVLPAERSMLNNTYILSCNDLSMEDNLTMWRLYGDNCKGVCIKFIIEKDKLYKDETFILAPVSYGQDKDTHYALEFVNSILSIKIGDREPLFETWCYWKHFFKDYRYSVEKEVRLLYTGNGLGKRDWILVKENDIPCTISVFPIKCAPNHSNDFPLTLKGIKIGSKCIDIETKKSQLEELIKERNVGYDRLYAEVSISEIDNYR